MLASQLCLPCNNHDTPFPRLLAGTAAAIVVHIQPHYHVTHLAGGSGIVQPILRTCLLGGRLSRLLPRRLGERLSKVCRVVVSASGAIAIAIYCQLV